MPAREPRWWYDTDNRWPATVLAPIAQIWSVMATRRMRRAHTAKAARPIICVGNFTAGGTGKTPFSIELSKLVKARGHIPGFLTRGYGATNRHARIVDLDRDTAETAGDEALLLARHGPVAVCADRIKGAQALVAAHPECTILLMDDGLQNPSLAKDLRIALIDGRRGIGNGRVIPAGPLRAPFLFQLSMADAVVVTGSDELEAPVRRALSANFRGPILRAAPQPGGDLEWMTEKPILAFAGIANPGRFFDLLRSLGGEIAQTRIFRDHHAFQHSEANELLHAAEDNGWQLVTTEKDHVRLKGQDGAIATLHGRARSLPISLATSPGDAARLVALVDDAVARHAR